MADEPTSVSNEFSGGDSDVVVQAGTVHGGVHVHRSGRSLPPPRQLPYEVPGFVNRAHELTTLDALHPRPADEREGAPAVVTAITGGPGVGKTALALRWAHRVRRRFTDGDLYIDMRGYNSGNTLGPEQALTSFLRGLGLVALEQHDPGAQEHFEAALTVFREHGIRRGEGMSLLSLAECARSRGDHAEASALCRRAIDIFRSIDDRWSEAWGALPLAESLGELGDFQEAEHHLGRALGTFRDFTDRRSEALTLRRLGDVSAGRRALTAARDLWTQAAAIYEELGDALSDELRRQAEGLPDAIDGDDRG